MLYHNKSKHLVESARTSIVKSLNLSSSSCYCLQLVSIVLFASLSVLPMQASASTVPKVVTDIPPTHSLVSMVMGELGTPDLLMRGAVSPHDYALRPSDAKSLSQAELVVWMHPELTPCLNKGLVSLAPTTPSTILMKEGNIQSLPARQHLDFLLGAGGEQGLKSHNHHHSVEPHGWLDPVNAIAFLDVITDKLGSLDKDNALVYRANALIAQQQIEKTQQLLSTQLSSIEMRPFLIMHDSIQYFEKRFSLSLIGSVESTDAVDAGPKRVRKIRALLKESEAQCVFAEVQENNTILSTITEGLKVKLGLLDPVGVSLATGAELYPQLLSQLTGDLMDCLKL